MKLTIQDATIKFSGDESEFIVCIAENTCLSIHDLILLSLLAFCQDGDKNVMDLG